MDKKKEIRQHKIKRVKLVEDSIIREVAEGIDCSVDDLTAYAEELVGSPIESFDEVDTDLSEGDYIFLNGFHYKVKRAEWELYDLSRAIFEIDIERVKDGSLIQGVAWNGQ